MNPTLQAELQRLGWDAVYERHISDLHSPNARGERISRSPFPYIIDNNPSFSVNVNTGLWQCWRLQQGGNYVQFRAFMEATEFDDLGRPIPDFGATERRLLEEFNIINPVRPEWVAHCRDILQNDLAIQHMVLVTKPWSPAILQQLNIGYDPESNRIVFPLFDRQGRLINCRMYAPGREVAKTIWLVPHATGNFLFPHNAWHEQVLILTEGEPDAISLRSLGFSACTGTMGSGRPVPEGLWWRNRTIYILFDEDEPGEEARHHASRELRDLAREVRICRLPQWEGRPDNADVSDYIWYLRRQGFQVEQQQRAIVDLLNNSQQVEHPHAIFDQPATTVSFAEALRAENLGRRIAFNAQITARSEKRYILPTRYTITCPATGHQYCQRCPMHTEFHGHAQFQHDPRSVNTLSLIGNTEKEQLETYKQLHGIVRQCPDPQAVTNEAVDVEPVILNAATATSEDSLLTVAERQRREAFIILDPHEILEENHEYRLEGFIYPHPKTQHGLFLIDHVESTTLNENQFELTEDLIEKLKIFQPGQMTIFDKLLHIAEDLANAVTLIRNRPDLHLAYRTVWHSVTQFNFAGSTVDRGWIEALILGDTRCGKSITFRRLSEFYGLGLLVDCKNQTPAGLLGAVVSSQSTGERYVVAGLLPQQDGRIVGLDEFHVPSWNRQGLIEMLSSTRSEGVVRISKAASAQFRARVRSIWMANPGLGRLMDELPSGVELINRLIRQPEDIARFDMAVAVSQSDVSAEIINSAHIPTAPAYSQELSRALLLWIYSRTASQIQFTPEAEQAVFALSRAMYEKYDASIPLVEPADQRVRVAKIAVAIAAQCFSTDEQAQRIVVKSEHVYATGQLFALWYDKPVMAYDLYSQKIRNERHLINEPEVRHLFDETMKPHGRTMASELLRLDQFTERTFGTLVPITGMFPRQIIQTLYANRCIKLVGRGSREAYELSPAFVMWLRRYLSEENS